VNPGAVCGTGLRALKSGREGSYHEHLCGTRAEGGLGVFRIVSGSAFFSALMNWRITGELENYW